MQKDYRTDFIQMATEARQLEVALKLAEEAHAKHEQEIGHKDPDWAKFYAEWIVKNTRVFD